MSVHIVIAHYNEDLEWTKKLKYSYTIISRKDIPQEVIPNKGNEASSYLEYIINNYNNLPDIIFFVHGHENSYHQKMDTVSLIDKFIKYDYEYYNFVSHDGHPPMKLIHFEYAFNKFNSDMLPIIEPIFGTFESNKLAFYGHAQFFVKKENIKKHSLETYKTFYNFLMNTDEISFWTGRYFEFLWCYIFTGNYIESY